MDDITGESIIMDYGVLTKGFVSYILSFLLYKTLIDGLEWCGLLMFLSAVWTLILTAPIHCRGSIAEQVMECYISPNLFP